MQTRQIFCCQCNTRVNAVKVTGFVIYHHRQDLWEKVFYQCPHCKAYVGTHSDGSPLGVIPSKELREARVRVHNVIDPLWKSGKIKRGKLYGMIARHFGLKAYHTGEIGTVEFADRVIEYVKKINL